MNEKNENSKNRKFDLEERTAKFGEDVIEFLQKIKVNEINRSLISQLVRSSTSVGANYEEADGAVSKKDFKNIIGICKKEAKESKLWLRMMAKANPGKINECRILWKEAHELTLIFSKIILSCNKK